MARITNKGISGVIGPVIYYSVNGNDYVRSKPGRRKKKRGQPENPLNTIFGTVSRYGSSMIKSMSKSFQFPFSLNTYNRVRGWMRDRYAAHKDDEIWELSAYTGLMCQLNTETDIRDFWWEGITVSDKGNGIVSVFFPGVDPVKAIRAPLHTQNVHIKIIALSSPFRNSPYPHQFCLQQYQFNYNSQVVPAKEIELQTAASAGDIAILVLAIEFETTAGYPAEKRWMPAAIVAMGKLKS